MSVDVFFVSCPHYLLPQSEDKKEDYRNLPTTRVRGAMDAQNQKKEKNTT